MADSQQTSSLEKKVSQTPASTTIRNSAYNGKTAAEKASPSSTQTNDSSKNSTPQVAEENTQRSSQSFQPNTLEVAEVAKLDQKARDEFLDNAKKTMNVDDFNTLKNDIEKEALTNNSANAPGRNNSGKVNRTTKDLDDGRFENDPIKIAEGDFIDFLMKEIVLASVGYVGGKVADYAGLAIYKVGKHVYDEAWDKGIKECYKRTKQRYKDKHRKNQEEIEKIQQQNLYSGVIKANGKTADFAGKILDIRKKYLDDALSNPEFEQLDNWKNYVCAAINGEMDIDNAQKTSDEYKVTHNYTDKNGNPITKQLKFSEEAFQHLKAANNEVKKQLQERNVDLSSEEAILYRKTMANHSAGVFEDVKSFMLKREEFVADYTASSIIEKASHLSAKEIKNIDPDVEFSNMVKGSALLEFAHHAQDIKNKNSTFQSFDDLTDTANAALKDSIKQVNNNQNKEAYEKRNEIFEYKDNPSLHKIELSSSQSKEAKSTTDIRNMLEEAKNAYLHDRANQKELHKLDEEQKNNQIDLNTVNKRREEIKNRKSPHNLAVELYRISKKER